MKELIMNLQLFSADVNPINVTTQSSMSPTMKTFYDTTLLENARETMISTQPCCPSQAASYQTE